jgi:hypothetical protein
MALYLLIISGVSAPRCREARPEHLPFDGSAKPTREEAAPQEDLLAPPSAVLSRSPTRSPLRDSSLQAALAEDESPEHEGQRASTGGRDEGKKSVATAAALSVLLPGLGELYGEERGRARIFFMTEAAVWATYAVLLLQGRMLEDDYRLFSVAHAGASAGIDDQDYYRALEEYRTTADYNEDVRREARKLYPDDEDAREAYILEHLFGEEHWWEWKESAAWVEYRSLRGRSREAFHRAAYCTAAAIANRAVSAVDAVVTVRRYNSNLRRPSTLRLEVEPTLAEPGIKVGLCYTH